MYAIGLLKISYEFIFDKGKTKCVFFQQKNKLPEINITYVNNRIKQYRMVKVP